MLEIRNNPETIFKKFSNEEVVVRVNRKEIILKGPNIKKYLIPMIKYLSVPSSIDELIAFLEKSQSFELDHNKIRSIIGILIDEQLLICRMVKESLTFNNTIKILLIDFTRKKMGRQIKELFYAPLGKEAGNYEVIVLEYDIFNELNFEYIENERFKIIVPIFWEVVPEVIEELGKITLDCILPVITNYNYFSIGPQISSSSSLESVIISLRKEMSRYYYINKKISTCDFSIFYAHVTTELSEVIKLFYDNNQENNSMTIKDMITFNYSSFSLIVKRYRNIGVGRGSLK